MENTGIMYKGQYLEARVVNGKVDDWGIFGAENLTDDEYNEANQLIIQEANSDQISE